MRISILFTFFAFIFFKNTSIAQMADGSTAPNWTLNDITGTSQNLYSHLNAGRPVVLDFSATWCNPCWNYHNSNAMKNFYNAYGASSGNYKANVFFIESSSSTSAGCLYGPSGGGTPFLPCSGSSVGDWTAGTPYPMIDNTALANTYQVGFYPTIYLVCPNKKIYFVDTQTKAGFESKSQTLCGVSLTAPTVPPLTYTNNVTNLTCNGSKNGSVLITVSGGVSPYSYAWSNGQTLATAQNLVAGTYKCTVTDNTGKKLVTSNFAVTEPIAIAVTSVAKTHEKCGVQGGIDLNVSGGANGFTYKWNDNSFTQNLVNPSQSGTYTVTVTDSKNCTITHSKDVTVHNFQPSVAVPTVPTLTCVATSVQLLATTPSVLPASSSVEWATSNGIIAAGYGTLKVSVTKAAAYSVKITDALSKCSATANVTVASNTTKPNAKISSNGDLTCTNNGTTFLYADTCSICTYIWNDASVNDSLSVSSAKKYTLVVSNSNNGCTASDEKIILDKRTTPTLNIATPTVLTCKNLTSILKADSVAGYAYLWNNGASNNVIIADSAGMYKLSITEISNGCKNIFSTIVLENKVKPNLILSVSNEINCKKTSADIKGNLTNGFIYLWSNGKNTPTVNVVNAGNYSTTVTSETNGCSSQQTATVIEVKNPTLEIASIVNAGAGTKNDGEIHLTPKLGKTPYTYTWTANGKSIVGAADLTNLAGGVYNVTLTDANACTVVIEKIILKGAVQVADLEEVSSFNAFPNPMSDKLNVNLSLKENQNVTLSLLDVTGRILTEKKLFSTQNISEVFETSNLQKGIYFLQIQINGKIKAVEIIKN